MKVSLTALPGVLVLEPSVFSDARGFFFESFNAKVFEEVTGSTPEFLQDNHSMSFRSVVRGLHYRLRYPQAKLVRAVVGEIFDVAVDVRSNSPTLGQWVGVTLSASNKKQLWIPEGFAHGFVVTSDAAEVIYKTTDLWRPEDEHCILWNDPALGIAWPLQGDAIVSARDSAGVPISQAKLPGPEHGQ